MGAGQLWLFPPPKPLVEKLGEGFFRALPPRPGVYLMCGPREGVLYVGKARNLRRRLASYRVANPERLPRRIIRLLHCVTRIEWDECPTEASAVDRERALIVLLMPRFNAAGKLWPR
jgi:excinuclease UvrABC nuclease subunit